MLEAYLTFGDERIQVRYVDGERQFAEETYSAVDALFPSLLGYFGVARTFPKVRVVLVPDRREYDRLVTHLLQVPIEVPSERWRIAQPQRTDMVALSPSAYEAHSNYAYKQNEFRRLMVHELTHMVEEFLSPDMEASPGWWSEGLAVYLSSQWRYEEDVREPAVKGVATGIIPSLRQIEAERKLGYQWGWTFVRFLEECYSQEVVVRVVQECADGDIFSVIGEQIGDLETQWRDWILGGGLQLEEQGAEVDT